MDNPEIQNTTPSSNNMILRLVLFAGIGLICMLSLAKCIGVQKEQTEAQAVASRLGVAPNWNAIRDHVYCKILVTGRPRYLIETDLERVGELKRNERKEYDKGRIFEARYDFQNQYINARLKEIRALYDPQDVLTERWQISWEGWEGLDTHEVSIPCE